ncbi:MAG: antitoxin [Verrucomicrobiae bacterium]|nr:antitoxin [Verrucomicrobiae bacterium]
MRTTVTLDPDVERMLRDRVRATRSSFKQVLNNAVREGLQDKRGSRTKTRFVVEARPLRLRAGIDPARLGEVADELEIEAFLRTSGRLNARKSP